MTVRPSPPPLRPLPRLHQPQDRAWIYDAGDWEIRSHAVNDVAHTWLRRRGALHLQVWHRQAQISIISPSPLTAGMWEVFDGSQRARARCMGGITHYLHDRSAPLPPCPGAVQHFLAGFVWAQMIGLVPSESCGH